MGIPLHRSDCEEEMIASPGSVAATATAAAGTIKDDATISRREKQKSYLGPSLEDRRLSYARKSAIKESLGAILRDDAVHHRRPRPTSAATTATAATTSPRRTKSGGSLLSAVASQAFVAPRRSVSTSNKSSALYDDPFIDALLGVQTQLQSVTITQQTPRKKWQGLGLDQFKEKMGYRKPLNDEQGLKATLSTENMAESTSASTSATLSSELALGGVSRLLSRRASKSPSFLKQRVEVTSQSERGTRSVDKAIRRLSLSSHHTRTTVTEDSTPNSASEHGRSIDVRRAPRRACSDEQHKPSRWHHDASSDLPPPPLGGSSPPHRARRGRKGAKQDSFYGLELEQDLKESSTGRSIENYQKIKSPSTSSHRKSQPKLKIPTSSSNSSPSPRTQRSQSRDKPSKRILPSNTITLRTPSARERKSLSARPSPNNLTPSTISSCPRHTLESTEGWADLELDTLDVADSQPLVDQTYGNDIQTAMVVGENLMNLGVQLLTRGHDLKSAATRRNSLLGNGSPRSKRRETHVQVEVDPGFQIVTVPRPRQRWDNVERLDDNIPRVTCTQNDDISDDESEIESLVGLMDESKRKYEHRNSSGDLESKHGTSLNSISSNGASFTSLLDVASSSIGTSFNSLMEDMGSIATMEEGDVLFSDLHDAAYATNNESMNNSGLFGDSWRGLELDFSDMGGTTSATGTKTRRKVGRHKSAPQDSVKKSGLPKGSKTQNGRPPMIKTKGFAATKPSGADMYSTSY